MIQRDALAPPLQPRSSDRIAAPGVSALSPSITILSAARSASVTMSRSSLREVARGARCIAISVAAASATTGSAPRISAIKSVLAGIGMVSVGWKSFKSGSLHAGRAVLDREGREPAHRTVHVLDVVERLETDRTGSRVELHDGIAALFAVRIDQVWIAGERVAHAALAGAFRGDRSPDEFGRNGGVTRSRKIALEVGGKVGVAVAADDDRIAYMVGHNRIEQATAGIRISVPAVHPIAVSALGIPALGFSHQRLLRHDGPAPFSVAQLRVEPLFLRTSEHGARLLGPLRAVRHPCRAPAV